ncbi:MAG: CheR family methyltransferase [bacterium]
MGYIFLKKKKEELRQGVYEAIENTDCKNLGEYYDLLKDKFRQKGELKNLISLLTTGETYFFRNKAHFEILKEKIFPEIINKKIRTTRIIRIMSAGCSTGEEPYSIAIILKQLILNLDKWDISILAVDINQKVLNDAIKGIYRDWSFRGVPEGIKKNFFTYGEGRYRIRDEIKKMVNFQMLNLIEDKYPSYLNNTYEMDLILCRNVTIYFKPETTRNIISRFFRCLLNGGYLIIGHSESSEEVFGEFKRIYLPDVVIFQRPGPAVVGQQTQTSRLSEDLLKLKTRNLAQKDENKQDDSPKLKNEQPKNFDNDKDTCPVKAEERRRVYSLNETELFEKGLSSFEKGKITEALNYFQEVVALNNKNARACYYLGYIKANREEIEEAKEWCQKAIKNDRLIVEAYYLLSIIYKEEGEKELAIEMLKKTIYINSNFILGHYNLGNVYKERNENRLAIKSFNNTKRILEKRSLGDFIEGTDGMTVGRLLNMVNFNIELLKED